MQKGKKRIAVLINGSPHAGAATKQFQTQLDELEPYADFQIHYLHHEEVETNWEYLGRPFIMPSGIEGPLNLIRISLGFPPRRFVEIAEKIASSNYDLIWVHSNDDGALLAIAIRNLLPQTHIHLSVNDHLGETVFRRSKRYRWLIFLGNRIQRKALQAATSCDVVASGMEIEAQKYCSGNVVLAHRCSKWIEEDIADAFKPVEGSSIVLGHIGAIYDKQMFSRFVDSFIRFCHLRKKSAELVIIGKFSDLGFISGSINKLTYFDNLPEENAIQELRRCSLTYCQYPLAKKFRAFPTTSFPTKASTYIMARTRILYHGPGNADIAALISRHKIGVSCHSNDTESINETLEALISMSIPRDSFKIAMADRFGRKNIDNLRAAMEI